MNADDMIDWFLLERYCAGTATAAEQTHIVHWIAADADRQDIVERVRTALQVRGSHERQDWRRGEAIEAVLAQVRTAKGEPALQARPHSGSGSATVRLADALRHWFDSATDLAAAMLLDANEQPLSAEETDTLRKQIGDRQRDEHER